MKTRDFHNSSAPVLRDPHSGALHVAPPLTAGAEIKRPLGHGGAHATDAPGAPGSGVAGFDPEARSSNDTPTEPPPATGFDPCSELAQYMTAFAPALKAASAPSYFDRLTGLCHTVLESDYAMGFLSSEAERAERAAGSVTQRPSSSTLAALVVGFADEVLRRATTLVEDREATTKP